jgi:hypothetical protein
MTNYVLILFHDIQVHEENTETLYTLRHKGRFKEFQFITILFSVKHNYGTADQYWRTVGLTHDVFHIVMFLQYWANHQRTPFFFYLCNTAMKSEAFRVKHSTIYPKLINIILGKNFLWMMLLLYPLRSLKATMQLLMMIGRWKRTKMGFCTITCCSYKVLQKSDNTYNIKTSIINRMDQQSYTAY